MSENYCDLNEGSILSDIDIQNEMKAGNLFIAPYEPLQLQPSGYNLTPTRLIYSTKRKKLLPVYEKDDEVYVIVEKNDTVLVRTRETIIVPAKLAGAFYSKVKVVSLGFGHVSTTLDPHWEGQLLISLNNPTNRKLKFSIEKNVYGKTIYNSFVTVQFMTLRMPTPKHSDNLAGRLDIFDATLERNVSIFKKNEVQRLRELVDKLHEYERKTVDTILIEMLDDQEYKEWQQIQTISDDNAYIHYKKEFLKDKHKKYIRSIRHQVNSDAVDCINIVNHYIEKKQKCLPFTYIVFHWLLNHIYELIGIFIALAVILMITSPEILNSNPLLKKVSAIFSDKKNNATARLLEFTILYILFPIIKKVGVRLWNRIQ